MVSPSLIVELVSSIVSESENVYGELDILIAKKNVYKFLENAVI
jgi:hypothetical protein